MYGCKIIVNKIEDFIKFMYFEIKCFVMFCKKKYDYV